VPARLATSLAIVALATALGAGCGGSSSTDSTATTGGEVEYEAEPAPGTGGPAGAAAKRCESEAAGAESLRATGVPCGRARQLMFAWQRAGACDDGASRGGCTVRSFRCVATEADRGTAVSCSREGVSIAFLVTRR
jgi:hypothetical protein